MHITDPDVRCWIMKEFETIATAPTSKEEKYKILEEITKSETFNQFLVSKFTTTKRFGVEGLESVSAGMSILPSIQTPVLKKPPKMEWNTLE